MRATLAYTTARILLFVAAVGLIYLAGARGLLLFGLALRVSTPGRRGPGRPRGGAAGVRRAPGQWPGPAVPRASGGSSSRSHPPTVSRCNTASTDCWRDIAEVSIVS